MAASDDDPAHSPRLDCEVCRRDVLRAAGAAGSTAVIASTPGIAQDNSTDGSDNTLSTAVSIGLSPGLSGISYFTNGSFDWISAWGESGESEFKEKYEYQQRLQIYRLAYDWEQSEIRALTGVENQADLYSRVAMEDGLLELYDQADQNVDVETALPAAKDVVRAEWDKLVSLLLDQYEQTVLSVKSWHDHLNQIETDLSDSSTTVSYTMVPECPYTGAIDDGRWIHSQFDATLLDGSTRNYHAISPTDFGNEVSGDPVALRLPPDFSTPGSSPANSYTNRSGDDVQFFKDIMNHIDDGFRFPEDQDESLKQPKMFVGTSGGASTNEALPALSSLRVYPPKPEDFDVDPAQVEDVSDQSNAHVLVSSRYMRVLDTIVTERQASLDGLETWSNSNYTDLKNNTDQWDRSSMAGPSALQESAETATNPANAALQLYGMGIPVNTETDVLLEFPNVTDDNGNPVQVAGYLGATNPPSGGFSVGEVIDPTERDGGIYLAHWKDALGSDLVVGDEGPSTNSTNTTGDNTTDGDSSTTRHATYTELTEPFEIVRTADGSDTLTVEARDISTPDYDWQQVVQNLEDLNAAQEDAQNQTIEVINEGGEGGPIIPDDFDLGTGSPLAGLAIIGAVVVAAAAAVSNLLPGN